MNEQIAQICNEAIEAKVFSGCVLGVILPDGTRSILPFGTVDYEGGVPMDSTRVFDIASVTKSVPVGTLALKRVLEQKLDLQMPVMDVLPEWNTTFREQVRVWHLLTHSLDYRFPMSSLKELSPAAILERLLNHNFREEPGSSFSYGNAASLLLGVLLERMSGDSLDDMAYRELFAPLEMKDTGWNPLTRVAPSRIMPTEICPWRARTIQGEVHDESAFAMGHPVGSAGVFSTVPDLLQFLSMMLADGVFHGKRLLPPGVLQMVTTNALPHVQGQGTALGWELANRRFMGEVASPRSFGKTGFTGASVVCDPDRNMAVALLTNFTWPKREASVERIYEIRRRLHDALFSIVPCVD